jgi:hypothetical protein
LEQRTEALKEYCRILKPNGLMVIAFPNHYSRPYRFSYNLLTSLNMWPYPTEEKIYDLNAEASATRLVFRDRLVLAKETALYFLRGLLLPFKLFYKCTGYDGYLTVVIYEKINCK